MWHLTRTAVERWMESLLHVHDTPERTAAAVALGVAIGFSPLIGFHMVLGVALAFLLNLNRVAVVAGVWVNLPWFIGPYYAAATALGALATGRPVPPQFLARLQGIWDLPAWRLRVDGLADLLRPMLLPYFLGSSVGALVLGFFAYRLTLAFLLARQRHRQADSAG